jgi:malate dehydrogenase
MKAKVSIIGAGNVGATTAQLIAYAGFADIVLFDITEGVPQGKALDIAEACPLWNSSVTVTGTNSFSDTAHSDAVVITAGFPRKPGMSRDDLLHANADVIKKVTLEISRMSPDCVIIVVTNPMDVMAQIALKISEFSSKKVIGMGGVLDSSRLRTFVSMELGVSPEDVEAIVLGGHGDQMVPLPRFTTVKGIPITELLSKGKIDEIMHRTKNGGAEIVSLLKTGSAYYAPAAASCQMVKSILFDEKRLLPCSAYLGGEFGINDIFVGVPVILGKNGIDKIVEFDLTPEEKTLFYKSATAVSTLLEKIGDL